MSRVVRLRRVLSAIRADRDRAGTERQPPDQRGAMQRERLDALVAHAVAHSPFYSRWYASHGVGPGAPLTELPVLDKPMLMANWDSVPVDRGLTLHAAREALGRGAGQLRGHDLFQTGGSSGVPGLFAYDQAAVDMLLANGVRSLRYNGVRPKLPRRVSISMIWAPGTIHMAARISALMDVGLYRMQRLTASAPVPELAAELEAHRPDVLGGYASTIGLLAAAQLDGTLDIAPRVVIPSAEPVTDAIRSRVKDAWGVEVFEAYAASETGLLAQECDAHCGLHVYEDTTILEPDTDRVFVTNLYNRAFPLIRFVLDDLVSVDCAPCPCGRTTTRVTAVLGRANDILELPSACGGAPVAVHPSAWTPITALDAVADVEIVQSDAGLTVRAVPRARREDTSAAVRRYVEAKFDELGIGAVGLQIETVDALPRTQAAKRKLVRRA